MDRENETPEARHVSRKTVLRGALAAGIAAPAVLMGGPALARTLTGPAAEDAEPTPMCDDGDGPTVAQIEGPYFKPNSPLRSSMVDGSGVALTLSGYVFGRGCQPISGVLLDFWQADTNGAYDNTGFRFRGHQFTDSRGLYTLTTIVPGLYPGRTRHIHVKAQAPGQPILTTQLYFPNEPRNNTDTIYDPRLLMNVQTVGGGRQAAFDFVLNVAQNPGPTPTATSTTTPPPGGGTWAPGVAYAAGARVTYGGVGYVCLQGHTSMTGWEPPNVPALWRAG
ncbi:dioxygenase family protein [Streptomyces smaragdinus]|nr:carbohydrate-binding protein [Streptomyces smaragdinus]